MRRRNKFPNRGNIYITDNGRERCLFSPVCLSIKAENFDLAYHAPFSKNLGGEAAMEKFRPPFQRRRGPRGRAPGRAPQSAKSLSFVTVKGVRNARAFRGGADTTAPPFYGARQSKPGKQSSGLFSTNIGFVWVSKRSRDNISHSLFRPKRHTVTFWRFALLHNATRRGGRVRPSSKRCRVSHLLLRFGRKGSFALCGARPKAPPLDFASWAQLDQL